MQYDYDEILKAIHEFISDINETIEEEGVAGAEEALILQDLGYPEVEEGMGCFSLTPQYQQRIADALIEHFIKDNGLSFHGKKEAVRMSIASSSPYSFFIEKNEYKENEFIAFLDHFSKMALKIEGKLSKKASLSVKNKKPGI